MEDDKYKEIFRNFDPELSSDLQFMTKLQHNIDSVEIVMQHSYDVRRRNRCALFVALLVGFVTGVIMTSLCPMIIDGFKILDISIPVISAEFSSYMPKMLTYFIAAILTGITAYNVYEITSEGLKIRDFNTKSV